MSTIQGLPHSLTAESKAAIDLDMLDLVLPLVRHKYVILLATGFGLLMATIIALLTQDVYTGTAVIMPPQQSQSSAGS